MVASWDVPLESDFLRPTVSHPHMHGQLALIKVTIQTKKSILNHNPGACIPGLNPKLDQQSRTDSKARITTCQVPLAVFRATRVRELSYSSRWSTALRECSVVGSGDEFIMKQLPRRKPSERPYLPRARLTSLFAFLLAIVCFVALFRPRPSVRGPEHLSTNAVNRKLVRGAIQSKICVVIRAYWGHGSPPRGSGSLENILRTLKGSKFTRWVSSHLLMCDLGWVVEVSTQPGGES